MKIIKNSFKAIIFFALAFTLSNCSKDDDSNGSVPTIYPQQNPLAGYLAASGFNQFTANSTNLLDAEIGMSFIPTVTGNINAITVKIPDAHLGMRVTIWDKVTATVIRTEILDVTAAGAEATKSILPLALVKNKEYVISCNSNDFYTRRRSDSGAVTYPFTVGDISITAGGYSNGSAQSIPNTFPNNYYTGDVSFVFQRTE